ncbi:1,3-beta-glucanosyltransferase [Ancistrocladus abbreviatus]
MNEDKSKPLSQSHGNANIDTTEDVTSFGLEDMDGILSGDSESTDVDEQDDEDMSGKLKDRKPTANASMVGGEIEAIKWLQKFAAKCQAQPHRGSKDGSDSIYGANIYHQEIQFSKVAA